MRRRISALINDRAEENKSGVQYFSEEAGGRTREDGVRLEWLITAPDCAADWQGILPFFCGDITPRGQRVPTGCLSDTEHPSQSAGIAYVRILAERPSLLAQAMQLRTVIGKDAQRVSETGLVWEVQNPHSEVVKLIISTPLDDEEVKFLEEQKMARIYEVGVYVANTDKSKSCTIPYGKLTWMPL
ncbi:hypothetical protein AX17_001895 [Amanita inopinata Kibby_2008]|nr:hypothetical protein AX17_001895 [Amanita inopinata Kibby_2008]